MKALLTVTVVASVFALAGCGQSPTPAPEPAPVVEAPVEPNDCNRVFTEECAQRAKERNERARGSWGSVRSDAADNAAEQEQND